jgi:hypothetical protein
VIERGVDRVLHRLVGLLHRLDVVLLAGDEDLADVAVLLDLEHAADLDDVVEQFLRQPGQFGLDHLMERGGDFEVAAADLCGHASLLETVPGLVEPGPSIVLLRRSEGVSAPRWDRRLRRFPARR